MELNLSEKTKRQDQSKTSKMVLTENKISNDKPLPTAIPIEKRNSSLSPEAVPDISNVVEAESQSTLDNPVENAIHSDHGSNLAPNIEESAPMKRNSKKTVARSSAPKTKAKVLKRKVPFSGSSGKPSSKRKLTSKSPTTSSRGKKRHGNAVLPKQASILSIRSLDGESVSQGGSASQKRPSSSVLVDDQPDRKRKCDIKMTASDELHELRESYNSIQPYFKKDNLMAVEQQENYASITTEKTSRKLPKSASNTKKYKKVSKSGKKKAKASKRGKKMKKASKSGKKMKKASKSGKKMKKAGKTGKKMKQAARKWK